jgi:hypothetical protein
MSTAANRREFIKAGAAILAGGVLGSVGARASSVLRHRPKRNIVLIVHDAMRGDRIGFTRTIGGRTRSLTPFLDTLAGGGLLFERAIAPSSWTPISMGAILYDTSPLAVYYKGELAVGGGVNLARRLSDRGYFTAGVVANGVLDASVIKDGFERVEMLMSASEDWTVGGKPTGDAVNRCVGRLLGSLKRSRSFFLYVHYVDTHDRYTAPAGMLQALGYEPNAMITTSRVRDQFLKRGSGTGLPFDKGLENLVAHYDTSVRYADAATRDLMGMLDDEGLLDDTLVMVTSDHGEEFTDGEIVEDRNIGHGYNLSFPEIHSPLIISERGGAAWAVSAPVSLTRAVNDTAMAFSSGASAHEQWTGSAADGDEAFSALLWEGVFAGVSYVSGNLRVYGHLDETNRLKDLEAFLMRGQGRFDAAEVPPGFREKMDAILARGDVRAFDPSKADPAVKKQLKALGYLN